jgi:hypothetical protein
MAKRTESGPNHKYGPLRTPMSGQIHPFSVPKTAINTNIPKSAPNMAPIQSPMAGNVVAGRSKSK